MLGHCPLGVQVSRPMVRPCCAGASAFTATATQPQPLLFSRELWEGERGLSRAKEKTKAKHTHTQINCLFRESTSQSNRVLVLQARMRASASLCGGRRD